MLLHVRARLARDCLLTLVSRFDSQVRGRVHPQRLPGRRQGAPGRVRVDSSRRVAEDQSTI